MTVVRCCSVVQFVRGSCIYVTVLVIYKLFLQLPPSCLHCIYITIGEVMKSSTVYLFVLFMFCVYILVCSEEVEEML